MDFAQLDPAMEQLEAQVQRALETGDESSLEVLGYGEVTLVLLLRRPDGDLAVKRLPVFPDAARFARYRDTLEEFLSKLRERRVNVAPTSLWSMPLGDGRVVGYCIQRALPRENVGSHYLRRATPEEAMRFFEGVLEVSKRVITPKLGLDVQVANWIVEDGGLVFVDVTTPVIRDDEVHERLDVPLFMTSLPWALRDVVRITMSSSIFDKYYSLRGALLDLLGNLHKERLSHLVRPFLERANRSLEKGISEEEVRAYYDGDAQLWSVIQRLRKSDRWWQRTVRHRSYPFLLPRAIAR